MDPGSSYSGGLNLDGTGLQFTLDGSVVKTAIHTLKARNPGTKVLISVGGGGFNERWGHLNEHAIAQFVEDFGLDGVDIDFELPEGSYGCGLVDERMSCKTDGQFLDIMNRIHSVMPQSAIISITTTGFGAYGEGKYHDIPPVGYSDSGYAINLMRSDAGKRINMVNIMAYDAGNSFSSKTALMAYKSYFPGNVVLGVEVPPEASNGHVLNIPELKDLVDFVNDNDGAGIMIWDLQKRPNGDAGDYNPNAQMISDVVCNKFGLENCGATLIDSKYIALYREILHISVFNPLTVSI